MNYTNLIHDCNIYEGLSDKNHEEELESHIKSRYSEIGPSFDHILRKLKTPNILVEVGTYRGASAFFFADMFEKLKLDTKIICIDSFLGSITHWTQKDFKKDLKLKNGYPQMYYDFLSSIIHYGYENVITPLPMTSSDGARLLWSLGIKADMIFIDASHEYPDVLLDINNYWNILSDGGFIFGDDYDGWEGVKKSVNQFCVDNKLNLSVQSGKWIIQKLAL